METYLNMDDIFVHSTYLWYTTDIYMQGAHVYMHRVDQQQLLKLALANTVAKELA